MIFVLPAVRHYIYIALGYIVLRVVYLLCFHPLADIPGPKLAAVTNLWKTRAVYRKNFTTELHQQHLKYGDVVRIGPNEVSIISPDEVSEIYGQKSTFLKGPFYRAWNVLGSGHFSNREPVSHRRSRQTVAGAYSFNHLVTLEKYCDSCTTLLFRNMDKASEGTAVIDLSQLIEAYAYDCVSSIGFGQTFGLLEGVEHSKHMLKAMMAAHHMIVILGTLSSLNYLVTVPVFSWLTFKILGSKGPVLFKAYGVRFVSERVALKDKDVVLYEDNKDMLYRFMEAKDQETAVPLPLDSVVKVLALLHVPSLMAGADTTHASMLGFLLHVYSHPPTLHRLREEMDEAISAGRLTLPITYAQSTHLEFFGACIKESMRLNPVIGLPLQRVVPEGGHVIGGRFYGAGTLIGMLPDEVHHDARAYGNDAKEWNPDRWLTEDRKNLERYNLVFGQGTRVCLGKNISLMEMSKLLPMIVYYYDLGIKDIEKPWKVKESWFLSPCEFWCRVVRRER
ncbi:cytochrome P450 [Hysterangium stoloniferum]|nr:cytochrome P450 [Hysterangium stoloniferum]